MAEIRDARSSVRVAILTSTLTFGVFVKVWSGAAYVAEPVKVWTGAAFVDPLAVKTWNGTSFV